MKKPAATARKNPLIWISILVVGLIGFVMFGGERGDSMPVISLAAVESTENMNIERDLLPPPGMRARQYIRQLRADGKPYPFPKVYEKAQNYLREGSLADAHLLYFFAAREDHLPSVMVMGEMSDPTMFRAENSLLDQADVIQAYKWYQKAESLGDQAATQRMAELERWARDQAAVGNLHAKQLLLNFK